MERGPGRPLARRAGTGRMLLIGSILKRLAAAWFLRNPEKAGSGPPALSLSPVSCHNITRNQKFYREILFLNRHRPEGPCVP